MKKETKRRKQIKNIKDHIFKDFGCLPIMLLSVIITGIGAGLFVYFTFDGNNLMPQSFLILNSFGRFMFYTLIAIWGIILYYIMILILHFTFMWAKRFYDEDRKQKL